LNGAYQFLICVDVVYVKGVNTNVLRKISPHWDSIPGPSSP